MTNANEVWPAGMPVVGQRATRWRAYPHLVRWEVDGLAFLDTDEVFLIRSPLFGP